MVAWIFWLEALWGWLSSMNDYKKMTDLKNNNFLVKLWTDF
jgi:hypothetical protein